MRVPPQPATIGSVVTVVQDKIFLIGGMYVQKTDIDFVANRFTGKTWQYSIGTSCWLEKQVMPQATVYPASASHGDLIYVAGGTAVGGTETTRVACMYAYDILANLWLRKANMHKDRSNFCLERIGNHLYACGGRSSDSTAPKNIEVYSIPDDQWTQLQDVKLHHGMFASSFVKDKRLYIVGGVRSFDDESTGSDFVSSLDTVNITLSKVTNLPFKCANHVCAVVTAART